MILTIRCKMQDLKTNYKFVIMGYWTTWTCPNLLNHPSKQRTVRVIHRMWMLPRRLNLKKINLRFATVIVRNKSEGLRKLWNLKSKTNRHRSHGSKQGEKRGFWSAKPISKRIPPLPWTPRTKFNRNSHKKQLILLRNATPNKNRDFWVLIIIQKRYRRRKRYSHRTNIIW